MTRVDALAMAERFAARAAHFSRLGNLALARIFTRDAAVMARLALELPQ